MQIESEHKKSTLMNKSKKYLVDEIVRLEHNNNVLHNTIDQQYINFNYLLQEAASKSNPKDSISSFFDSLQTSKELDEHKYDLIDYIHEKVKAIKEDAGLF